MSEGMNLPEQLRRRLLPISVECHRMVSRTGVAGAPRAGSNLLWWTTCGPFPVSALTFDGPRGGDMSGLEKPILSDRS